MFILNDSNLRYIKRKRPHCIGYNGGAAFAF